jgi:predicted TIM-barrel fold metal-dependent hydrolase
MSFNLISADSHVTIPEAAWQQYLSPEHRAAAPRIERTDDGDVRVFEGRRSPINALTNLAGKKPQDYTSTIRRLEDQRAGAWDPAERIRDQDIDGVDAEVLYVGGPLVGAQDDALRLDSYGAYNRWLADFCSHAPDRLIGVAAVPNDTPSLAVEELRRARADGLRSAYVPLFPRTGEYGDPEWDPFWEAAVELGMPIAMHVGGKRGVAQPRYGSAGGFMTDLVMSKLAMAEAVSELIFGLVLQRHPDLRIVSVEAQIGWISFVQYYMDHLWEKHRYWTKSELEQHPSTFFRRQVFATFMEDPVGLRERHEIGIDNIMWSSDYPHSETTWPNSKSLTDEWAGSMDPADKAKILWQNAARLYGLDRT